MSQGKHSKLVYCSDCERNVRVWIPNGVTVEEYIKDNVCPECKNKTLKVMPKTWR